MSKIKNGGLDQYGTLNTLRCNHLASLGLEGLTNQCWAVLLCFIVTLTTFSVIAHYFVVEVLYFLVLIRFMK